MALGGAQDVGSATSEPYSRVLLRRLDYTRQIEAGGNRLILHRDEHGRKWAVPLDAAFNAMVSFAADLELIFGYDREIHLDLTGLIDAAGGVELPKKIPTDPTQTATLVRVDALSRPGQFAVFAGEHGPFAPDLTDLRGELEEVQKAQKLPSAPEPKDLLAALLTIVKTGNLALFGELSTSPQEPTLLRRRFAQFVKGLELADGRISFDRYDARWSPQCPGPNGAVKMFVKRINRDGTEQKKPLTFLRQDGHWRLKSGVF